MKKSLYLDAQNNEVKINTWKEALLPLQKNRSAPCLKQAALIVIDMQNYFLDEKSHAFIPTGEAIVPNVQRLLTFFRDEGLPIVFTRFAVQKGEPDPIRNWWGDSVSEGSKESEVVEELKPQAQEKVLRKTSYDSFHGTDLEQYLKSHNVRDVIITGVLTNLCCEMAARESFTRGFSTFFAMDATATFNEDLHLTSLINIASGFATPLTTEEVLNHNAT